VGRRGVWRSHGRPKSHSCFARTGKTARNRRVPSELLGGLEGDEPAHAYIHVQDREIAEKGGRPALEIKSISRVGAKKKKERVP